MYHEGVHILLAIYLRNYDEQVRAVTVPATDGEDKQ